MKTAEGLITESLLYHATNRPSEIEKYKIVDFLSKHLDGLESNKENIRGAIEYSTKEKLSFGGLVIVKKVHDEIVGVSIVNQTGMQGYMAENVLVYIAVSKKFRNKGIAKMMVEQVLRHAKGDVALHLKGDSSLAPLCEKFGFKNSIVEMRLVRN
ncbi:MAG TPA: GNAT family N-acetyltransferase [Taishania sp.]|nr:GNAT family N-acetyltransferase [Taishania sp.]